ncbi:MAG: chromate transporter [Lachnospiraceae bacterium]|nr:chromate transporter [Lachnospiraceae bacterium]
MLVYLKLFYEFSKIGLFAVGGGLATLPFLYELAEKTGWFTTHDISNMIAISESTPGAIGINMSTYVGFHTAYSFFGLFGAILGGITTTISIIIPSIIVIEVISGFLNKFKESKTVKNIFYGLRPASTGLVASAGLSIAKNTLITDAAFSWSLPAILQIINWQHLVIGAAIFAAIRIFKLHPIFYIAASAAIGIILKL